MSYQQAINSALGGVARVAAVGKGLFEVSKTRQDANVHASEQAEAAKQWRKDTLEILESHQNVLEYLMDQANERAAQNQESRRIQKENMAYFAGKFWKEQK